MGSTRYAQSWFSIKEIAATEPDALDGHHQGSYVEWTRSQSRSGVGQPAQSAITYLPFASPEASANLLRSITSTFWPGQDQRWGWSVRGMITCSRLQATSARIGRADHVQVQHRPSEAGCSDRLMGRAVLAEAAIES